MGKLAGITGLLGTALLAGACGGRGAGPIDPQVFEDAMVQLRLAEPGADSAEFAARRQNILDSLGLTDSVLYAFVAAHETDPEFMAEVWEAIDVRVNAPPPGAESDTVEGR
jgi:hypothetical protein